MNNHSINTNLSSLRFWRNAAIALAAVVIIVNITFIVISESTNPGLVNEEYNEYGSKQYLIDVQYRQQLERGWTISLDLPETLISGQSYTITLNASDKNNMVLTGILAELAFYRPSDINKDAYFTFTESQQTPGVYSSVIRLDNLGVWDVNLLVKLDNKTHIEHRRMKVIPADNKDMAPQHSLLKTIVNFVSSHEG